MTGLAPRPERNNMQPGDRVRVSRSVVVYTHPPHRGSISPNLPVVVAFGKFRAHFRDDEITPI